MLKQTALLLATSALASLCSADIVLSVAAPHNMDSYLSVLSHAWPRIYPQLEAQLETARVQVPAEYQHMLQILSITGVPSTYDQEWARGFVGVAQRIGPTTIFAKDIQGAFDDPAMRPTNVVVATDASGNVATITNPPMDRPTIVVAINGNAVPRADSVQSSGSSSGASSSNSGGGGSSSGSSESGSSGSSSSSSGSSSASSAAGGSMRIPAGAALAFALVSTVAS
ncbi:hypothetical protein GGF38_002222, partial [Coemansia sp. RSA 25]